MFRVHCERIYIYIYIYIAGSKLDAQAVVTMETSSAFLKVRGISKRTVFFINGLAKYES